MKKIGLILLAFLILLVRFCCLDRVPIHLSNDEISIAYDAYSVGLTGQDEHGQFLPLAFESHGVHKAPLYAYLAILPIRVLGNTEQAVRVVSVVAGLLAIVFLGLLVYQLTDNRCLGLISALTLAWSPFHIYSSRVALEANLALGLLIPGIYFFWKWEKQNRNFWLVVSALFFSLSIYAYHLEWMLVPLLVLGLLYFKSAPKISFKGVGLVGLIVVFCLPLFLDYLFGSGRLAGASGKMVWGDPAIHGYLLDGGNPLLLKLGLVGKTYLSNLSAYFNLGSWF
ncbi:MAG: glycosyltransferase family 39 protein, partial [Patescibacteria group bacterium]